MTEVGTEYPMWRNEGWGQKGGGALHSVYHCEREEQFTMLYITNFVCTEDSTAKHELVYGN